MKIAHGAGQMTALGKKEGDVSDVFQEASCVE